MTLANYLYIPIFGVEPYLKAPGQEYADPAGTTPAVDGPYGSAVDLTSDNLITSIWTITTQVGGRPTAGAALQWFKQSSEYNPGDAQALPASTLDGYLTPFESRGAAAFNLRLEDAEVPDFAYPLLVMLNPPSSYKNLLARAYGVGSSLSGGPAQFNRGYATLFRAWNLRMVEAPSSLGSGTAVIDGDLQVGSTAAPGLSLVQMSDAGLDGSYPQIPAYDPTNPAFNQSQIDLASSGDYLVPAILDATPGIGDIIKVMIEWPFSAGRT